MADTQTPKKSGWLNLLIDFGPVAVYFIAYRLLSPDDSSQTISEVMAVTQSTMVFVLATVIALIVSKWRLGKVSPMLWLTTVLVVGFGLLTVWSQDEFWIRHKPTAVYVLLALVLFGGLLRGKAVLRYLLESAFEGLNEEGWRKLSRNWAVFFLVLAGINEVFANPAWFTFDQWLKAKLFVFLPLSFLFTFTQIPMLMRHGLNVGEKDEVVNNPPHE